jgi:hypothetical protein
MAATKVAMPCAADWSLCCGQDSDWVLQDYFCDLCYYSELCGIVIFRRDVVRANTVNQARCMN